MRYLLLTLAFLTSYAIADSAVISWTPPTERVDGTPLAADEIGNYILRQDSVIIRDDIPGTDVTVTVSDLGPGQYCFDMATQDTEGRIGPFSDATCKPVLDVPSAPALTILIVIE